MQEMVFEVKRLNKKAIKIGDSQAFKTRDYWVDFDS